MKVLCFGSLNIDHVYRVKNIVTPGETTAAGSYMKNAGGKGLNQSVALARAGAEVYHAGRIGKDGAFLLDVFRDAGVDTGFVETVDTPTGHAVIQVADSAQNSIIVYGGANRTVDKAFAEKVLANFSSGDILLVQNEISGLSDILTAAKERGMYVYLNPSPFDDAVKENCLTHVDCLILNETEAAGYREGDFISYMKARHPHLAVILTLGGDGSVYFDAKTECRAEAFKVSAVDTTAAGDTFTGYVITALADGLAPRDALRRASAAAALAVTKKGAAGSIPAKETVDNFLKENKK